MTSWISLSRVFLAVFFLFMGQAWAENWMEYSKSEEGEIYYDRSSITRNENVIQVKTKTVLNEKGKAKVFDILGKMNMAPCRLELIGYEITLERYDCQRGKYSNFSTTIYDQKNRKLLSQRSVSPRWKDIRPGSIAEKLKRIVCAPGGDASSEKGSRP